MTVDQKLREWEELGAELVRLGRELQNKREEAMKMFPSEPLIGCRIDIASCALGDVALTIMNSIIQEETNAEVRSIDLESEVAGST